MLRLTVFGGLRLRGEGLEGPVAGVPRRALALLVLIADHVHGVSRDKVLACLWPESDGERGRNALRQTLHTLRRELRLPDLLAGDPLELDPAVVSSDLRDFLDAKTGGRLNECAALYSGPFLEGFHVGGAPEFDRWAEARRAFYAAEAAAALEVLARTAAAAGGHARAAELWRRLAALDPLNGRFALGLMEALAAAGDPAGALRQARVHGALLREELGAEPDATVMGLAERLRSAASALRPAPGLPKPPGRPGSATGDFLERLRGDLDGRYAVEGEVERGRDGAVRLIRARDLRHDRPVLLKVVHPAIAGVMDVDRFLREIAYTARLRHPHVVPLLDSGEVAGRPWYSMPDPGGETLRARLGREPQPTVEETVRLAGELAGALDHAHGEEIIHRDVTPENVLLTEGGALLTNLGVARAVNSAAGARLTETGVLVGNPAYMSPEQAAGEAGLDGRSDQFSLACVVYEALAGEALFSGPSPQAIAAKRSAGPAAIEPRLRRLPRGAASALARALSDDPARRFPTAREFAATLTARGTWAGWWRRP